ncbi:hypothetical protein ACJJJB_02470 [Microbulbifer sp. ANSA001]|uniref:hypothetical protein n=1 Tax=Microbulbifer sp. ANSA001 TaxID=3243358 RepID=UPI0040416541
MGSVSGQLKEHGSIQSFSELLIQLGGAKSEDEYRLELNGLFKIVNASDKPLQFSSGQIMAYPDLDEALIDLVGISYPEYGELFPEQVKAYEIQFKNI